MLFVSPCSTSVFYVCLLLLVVDTDVIGYFSVFFIGLFVVRLALWYQRLKYLVLNTHILRQLCTLRFVEHLLSVICFLFWAKRFRLPRTRMVWCKMVQNIYFCFIQNLITSTLS